MATSTIDSIEKSYAKEVRDSVVEAMNAGLTVKDWIESFNAINARYGVGEGIPSYVDMVFRTIQMSALNGGKVSEMFSAEGQARAEYWQFAAVMDDRTTDECIALDGMIFRKDDVDAMDYIPPISFNCRSSLIELDASEVEGGTISAANTTDISVDFANDLLLAL